MKEIFFLIGLLFLKNFLFNDEFIIYMVFSSLFFIIYCLSAESASNYFNEERSVLKNTVLSYITSVNENVRKTNAELLEKQRLISAQFLTK